MTDESITPVDRPAPRHASDDAFRIAYGSTLLAAIAAELAEIGALLDKLEAAARVDRLRSVAEWIGESGATLTEISRDLKGSPQGGSGYE